MHERRLNDGVQADATQRHDDQKRIEARAGCLQTLLGYLARSMAESAATVFNQTLGGRVPSAAWSNISAGADTIAACRQRLRTDQPIAPIAPSDPLVDGPFIPSYTNVLRARKASLPSPLRDFESELS